MAYVDSARSSFRRHGAAENYFVLGGSEKMQLTVNLDPSLSLSVEFENIVSISQNPGNNKSFNDLILPLK